MSSVYSDSISLLEPISTQTSLQVQFSYYANSMESFNDGFCLDYSTDNGIHWHAQQCWYSQSDFENEHWYDDTAVAVSDGAGIVVGKMMMLLMMLMIMTTAIQ